MKFWRRKRKRAAEIEAIFEKMQAAIFPGGETQINAEATELSSLLGDAISPEYAKESLIHAKARAFLALRSADSLDDVVDRCIRSVRGRNRGKLDRGAADAITVFAVRKLVEQTVDYGEQHDTVSLFAITRTMH